MDPTKIFISYSRKDTPTADRIVGALRDLGHDIFIDAAAISPGDSFVGKINQALAEASYVLLLLSSFSVDSAWVTMEYEAAIAMGPERGLVLIPILLDNSPVPPLLTRLNFIDLRTGQDGIQKLVSFFSAELSPIKTEPTAGGDGLPEITRRELRLIALRCMSAADLKGFLFEADMDPGTLEGNSHHERIADLLLKTGTDGQIEFLERWLLTEPRLERCAQHQLDQLRKSS